MSPLEYEIKALSAENTNIFQKFFRKQRHNTVINEIKSLGLERARVLEIGCGIGNESIELSELGYDVVGTDINPEFISYAKEKIKKRHMKNISFFCIDFEKKVKKLGKFQIVLISEVLEHTREWRTVLHNAYNLLSDGGYLVITVPNPIGITIHEWLWSLRARYNWFDTHYTKFTIKDIVKILNESGFRPVNMYTFFYCSQFLPPLSLRLADTIFEKELKYLSKKIKIGAIIMAVSRR